MNLGCPDSEGTRQYKWFLNGSKSSSSKYPESKPSEISVPAVLPLAVTTRACQIIILNCITVKS